MRIGMNAKLRKENEMKIIPFTFAAQTQDA
jgi:hypothetical protein